MNQLTGNRFAVYQTKLGDPDGNCLAACIATIFSVPIDSVPDFGQDSTWYENFERYCVETLGVKPFDVDINKTSLIPPGYHIINGPSKNGDWWHAVVGYNGKVIHDPHPQGPALKQAHTWTLFLKVIV